MLYGDNLEIIFNLNDYFFLMEFMYVFYKIKLFKNKKRYVGRGFKYVIDNVIVKYGCNGVFKVIIFL